MISVWLWAFLNVASAAPTPVIERQVAAMGTRLELKVEAQDRESALRASDHAIEAVKTAEKRLSTWDADSELSKVNRAEPDHELSLSPKLARDLDGAFACSRLTQGRFNPAVGPLIAAWDLRGSGRLPSEAELQGAVQASDAQSFELKPGTPSTILKHASRARLEEGGFGKGVGLDDAADALRLSGVKTATLDFGGQVLLLGPQTTQIAIANPRKRDEVLLTLSSGEGSISTSGNSEHGLKVGSRRVGHILDPKTGRPAPFDGTVTVVAPTGAEADCLSTGLFVMGPHDGLAWLRDRGTSSHLDAVFVYPGPRKQWLAQASCGLKGRLKSSRSEVHIQFDCPKGNQP